MTKRRSGLTVKADLDGIFNEGVNSTVIKIDSKSALTIEKALEINIRQMRASGLRERTTENGDRIFTCD
ncbi:hypothetical protein LZ480_10340 [Solibacillus sp. MA9]|uniref:Uncharacterized protein n=1 Tax=Solibacillus palustris TaxID=2908203 RepID=A0ABS9UD85_9BACL|nr:hypothetical protein [Solibacillus sp. MA9]MCH7322289.1 hypothetical protein [Solibacillus sp. MA9]